jgi:FMN phosphatase YigB (HAD superfamily)
MRTMRPDVVVFDLGKVLVDFDYSIASRKIAARGKVSASKVQNIIDDSALLFRYETGRISRQEFFDEVRASTQFAGDMEEFGELFADIFSPIHEMIELHARLRLRKIPTFIFSNTNDLAIGHIRRQFPFFTHFDGYVFSYEQGAMKPEARLYEILERVAGKKGDRLLYLDDRLENVEAGRARGWQVIHHQTAINSIETVEKLGLV